MSVWPRFLSAALPPRMLPTNSPTPKRISSHGTVRGREAADLGERERDVGEARRTCRRSRGWSRRSRATPAGCGRRRALPQTAGAGGIRRAVCAGTSSSDADQRDDADDGDRPEGRRANRAAGRAVCRSGTPSTLAIVRPANIDRDCAGPLGRRATRSAATTAPMPKNAPWHSAAMTRPTIIAS